MQFTCCFRWGGWSNYFSSHYLPEYDFSGEIRVQNGHILKVERMTHPHNARGPSVFTPVYEELEGPRFSSSVHNWMDGIRVTAETGEDSLWTLDTAMGQLTITPRQLMEQGHIMQEVGEPYSMTVLIAEPDEEWFLEDFPPEEQIYRMAAFPGHETRDWYGVRGVMLRPGEQLDWTHTGFAEAEDSLDHAVLRIRLRFLINGEDNKEVPVRAVPRLALEANGHTVWTNAKFSMFHNRASQYLEEQWIDVPAWMLAEGENAFRLKNTDDSMYLLVQLVGIRRHVCRHMSVVGRPQWGRQGTPFAVTLHVEESALLDIDYDRSKVALAVTPDTISNTPFSVKISDLNTISVNECALRPLSPGDHTFSFVPLEAGADLTVTFTDRWSGRVARAVVSEVWGTPESMDPVQIGVELQTGTPAEYIPLIRRIRDEQLGNLVVFRDYHNDSGQPDALWDAAAYCRHYGLYTDAIIMDDQAVVAAASAEHCVGTGTHEHTGIFYGRDQVSDRAKDMEEAQQEAISDLRAVADTIRVPGVPVSVGDASGGSRCAYQAGFDRIRHETFVGHHMLILPNARGAARTYGKTNWGAHVASQHNALPEFSLGIRRFWLSMVLPWVMGAQFIFDEDSLFTSFTDRRMTGQDYLPRNKQAINRWLYKYAATHPRIGEPVVDIAVMQGRFAPPISGLSTASNGNAEHEDYIGSNYPVWAHTGRYKKEWGYRQPEKGLHLLDVLAPNMFLTPLHQDSRRIRRFFSGCPKGEFDFLPIEAGADVMQRYKLLLFLDWHTMSPETDDYDRLRAYAEQGGTVFLSVPHLTTRSDRAMLRDMEDLQLYQQGEVADLCGVRIGGKSECAFSGARWQPGWEEESAEEPLLRRPDRSPDEDGPCCLADVELVGAEVVARDADSGRPLLTRYSLGQGTVYLLCTYAWPGHEALAHTCRHIVDRLTDEYRRHVLSCRGETRDVYYSLWGQEDHPHRVYLLNTDWANPGCRKSLTMDYVGLSVPVTVEEGTITERFLIPQGMLWLDDASASMVLEGDVLRIRSFRPVKLCYHLNDCVTVEQNGQTWQMGEPHAETRGEVPLFFGGDGMLTLRLVK